MFPFGLYRETMPFLFPIKEIETMNLFTCYNQNLQRYNYKLTKDSFDRKKKKELLAELERRIDLQGKSFHRLLPNKKLKVVDHILYLLTASGVNTIHTKTLMKKYDIKSRTTVIAAVKVLKESGLVLVCRLANGHAGTYVFVLKTHSDFPKIMEKVFSVDKIENIELQQNEQQNIQQVEQLQNAETVGTVGTKDEKTSSISFISFSLKQDTNIKQSIENESLSITNPTEYINTYYVNEYQKRTYHHIQSENFQPSIKDVALILGLRVGSNCNYRGFVVAKAVLRTIDSWIANGMEIKESIQALFSEQYKKELKKATKTKDHLENNNRIIVPFYNWLEQ